MSRRWIERSPAEQTAAEWTGIEHAAPFVGQLVVLAAVRKHEGARHRVEAQCVPVVPEHRAHLVRERRQIRLVQQRADEVFVQVAVADRPEVHCTAQHAAHDVVAEHDDLLREVHEAARIARPVQAVLDERAREPPLEALDERLGDACAWAQRRRDGVARPRHKHKVARREDARELREHLAEAPERVPVPLKVLAVRLARAEEVAAQHERERDEPGAVVPLQDRMQLRDAALVVEVHVREHRDALVAVLRLVRAQCAQARGRERSCPAEVHMPVQPLRRGARLARRMPEREHMQRLGIGICALDEHECALGEDALAGHRLVELERDAPLGVLECVPPVRSGREAPKEEAALALPAEQVLGRREAQRRVRAGRQLRRKVLVAEHDALQQLVPLAQERARRAGRREHARAPGALKHAARMVEHDARLRKRVDHREEAARVRRRALRDGRGRGARLGALHKQLVVHVLQRIARDHEPIKARHVATRNVLLDDRRGERLDGLDGAVRVREESMLRQCIVHKHDRVGAQLQMVLAREHAQDDAPEVGRHPRRIHSRVECLVSWTTTPSTPSSPRPPMAHALRAELRATLDMLVWPHPADGAFPGSTMAAGIDRWRRWCRDATELWTGAGLDPASFADAPLVDLVAARAAGALALGHATTVARVRALLHTYLDLWHQVYRDAAPPKDLVRELRAHARGESPGALVLADILLARYGTAALTDDVPAYFAALVAAVQTSQGAVGVRSRLAVAFARAAHAEGRPQHAWLAPLASALVHGDERAVDNLLARLVGPLLDDGALLPALLAGLGGAPSDARVRALLAVLRAGKVREQCAIGGEAGALVVPLPLVRACVASAVPRIQVAALALAVDAKTPAAPLSAAECTVVREFFAQSLMLPSAVARKDSIALLVKLLVRLRVSAHAARRRAHGSALLDAYQELGGALVRLVVHAMHPGAPYACTSLALAVLLLAFEAEAPGAPVDDSTLADAIRALAKAHRTYPGDFALDAVRPTAALVRHLCHLASHSTYSDVQDMATLLLVRMHARAPLPGLDTPELVAERIVRPAHALVVSPNDAEAHGGTCLVQVHRALCRSDDTLVAAHLARLDALVSLAESRGLAAASTDHALNGTLAVLRVLGADARVLEPVRRVWRVVRTVLTAAAPEGADGEDDDAALDAALLAPAAAQRVLSYAWRAMREAAALLAALVQRAPDTAGAANTLFVEWLLTIRHRGAFSTIYPSYQAAARSLLARAETRGVPAAWLAALLRDIERRCAAMSTTRRSAGLGGAVLALLSAHPPREQGAHVAHAVAALERMVHTGDAVPTVHALNIMRVLVMDSTLAGAMAPYTTRVLTHAVVHFSAAEWAVRNASMMLFASTSTRVFGARAFERGSSAPAARTDAAALAAALVRILDAESHALSADTLAHVGHGSALYAALLLLGKLRPDAARSPAALAAVARCTRSANWKLREQAAQCYASLVGAEDGAAAAAAALAGASVADQNALHGALLTATALAAAGAHVPDDAAHLLTDNPCPATCEAYLRLAETAGMHVDPAWFAAFFGGTSAVSRSDPFAAWLLPTALRCAFAAGTPPSLVALLRESDDSRDAVVAFLRDRPLTPDVQAALAAVVLDEHAALSGRIGAAALLDRAGAFPGSRGIVSLAAVTPSTALRDALLPLLGIVARDAPAERAPTSAILAECARATASVSSRMGAARALCHMKSALDTGTCAYALWHTVLTLLRDDDGDVRAPMAALVSESLRHTIAVPPESPLAPLVPSVERLPVGLETCADRVWTRLRDADAAQCAAELWRIMTSELDGAADGADAALFPAEEANQFYDPVADMLRAYRAFKSGTLAPPPSAQPDTAACTDILRRGAAYRPLLQSALVVDLVGHGADAALARATLHDLSITGDGCASSMRRLRIA